MKPSRVLAWVMLTALVTGLVPIPSAFADEAPAAAPAPLAESLPPAARQSYDAARLLFGDKDYAGALLKFSQAYDSFKDARLLWNMAACEKQLRHYAKATTLLQRYLAEGGASLTAQDRTDATGLVQTLEPFTAKLLVTSNEEGVDVTVDDERVGATPLSASLLVDIGTHRIVGTKEGFSDVKKELTVTGGEPVSAILTVKKIVHEGRVAIVAGASDAIFIDGKSVGTHEYSGKLPSGGHDVRVTAAGMRTYQSELVLADGEARTLNVTLTAEAKGGVPAWLIVTGIGVVVAGAAVGGYFLFRGNEEPGARPVGTLGSVSMSFGKVGSF
ncbi:MAG TPA: PEGA domain-containing protein [Polyangiaceae bacterium]